MSNVFAHGNYDYDGDQVQLYDRYGRFHVSWNMHDGLADRIQDLIYKDVLHERKGRGGVAPFTVYVPEEFEEFADEMSYRIEALEVVLKQLCGIVINPRKIDA